jgi:hypothetical protein
MRDHPVEPPRRANGVDRHDESTLPTTFAKPEPLVTRSPPRRERSDAEWHR